MRAMDCARCHGRDYRGWSVPSLIAAVPDGSRERFDWFVLEGDIVRGMPGYRSQPLVVAELDAIYIYLRALAEQAAIDRGQDASYQRPAGSDVARAIRPIATEGGLAGCDARRTQR